MERTAAELEQKTAAEVKVRLWGTWGMAGMAERAFLPLSPLPEPWTSRPPRS